MLWLFSFEVEVQRNERPVAVIALLEGLFDDRSNMVEEVVLHCWLVTADGFSMGDERCRLPGLGIGVPVEILLDGERCSGGECAVDAVVPPFKIGITIVC